MLSASMSTVAAVTFLQIRFLCGAMTLPIRKGGYDQTGSVPSERKYLSTVPAAMLSNPVVTAVHDDPSVTKIALPEGGITSVVAPLIVSDVSPSNVTELEESPFLTEKVKPLPAVPHDNRLIVIAGSGFTFSVRN